MNDDKSGSMTDDTRLFINLEKRHVVGMLRKTMRPIVRTGLKLARVPIMWPKVTLIVLVGIALAILLFYVSSRVSNRVSSRAGTPPIHEAAMDHVTYQHDTDEQAARSIPTGMVLIRAGANTGTDPDFGSYSLRVDAFMMDATLITKAHWDLVYDWALANGYQFGESRAQGGRVRSDQPPQNSQAAMDVDARVKAMLNRDYLQQPLIEMADTSQEADGRYPVHYVSWYDVLKWCNARSEMEGRTPVYDAGGDVYRRGDQKPVMNVNANGYRLPTDQEWEYAARGGLRGYRFPWGNEIDHTKANYHSNKVFHYDISPTPGYHPAYREAYDDSLLGKGFRAALSLVGSFPPNGFGLYDMAGNVWEWTWDATGAVARGGSASSDADKCRIGTRIGNHPTVPIHSVGFRTVVKPGPAPRVALADRDMNVPPKPYAEILPPTTGGQTSKDSGDVLSPPSMKPPVSSAPKTSEDEDKETYDESNSESKDHDSGNNETKDEPTHDEQAIAQERASHQQTVLEPDYSGNLVAYRGRNGAILNYRMTATTTGAAWGTDIYTDDSLLSLAAVHAGRIEAGQDGIVTVMILPGRDAYVGSTRNNITTRSYGRFQGSFTFIDNLDFGQVVTGSSVTQTMTIFNTTDVMVRIDAIELPNGFSCEWRGEIPPHELEHVVITFNPTTSAQYDGKVIIHADAEGLAHIMTCRGIGVD